MAPLQIGVMMDHVQLSDISCIDLLGNMSTQYIQLSEEELGISDLKALSFDMVFHYIATSLEPTFVTPSMKIVPTTTYDDATRDLDILIIGGPLPSFRPAAADKFMREAAEKTKSS